MKTEELETEARTEELRYLKPKTIAIMMDVSVDTVLAMMHRGNGESQPPQICLTSGNWLAVKGFLRRCLLLLYGKTSFLSTQIRSSKGDTNFERGQLC